MTKIETRLRRLAEAEVAAWRALSAAGKVAEYLDGIWRAALAALNAAQEEADEAGVVSHA